MGESGNLTVKFAHCLNNCNANLLVNRVARCANRYFFGNRLPREPRFPSAEHDARFPFL